MAVADHGVLATGTEQVERQSLAVKTPHFGHPQNSVDGHAVDGAAGDVHLDREVGRWIHAEIEAILAPDKGLVRNPVTVIGLQAALLAATLHRRGTVTRQRQP
jgi:hypothetical protein